ncbi:MAG: hypothetical protein V4694_04070 [Pseudomonadota bacterium]
MTEFNSENPDPRNRFIPEEEGINLDDILKFIEEIKKHGFNATNPKAQEILKKFPHKLQEYLVEIEKIKKDKERENPNETLEEKEKRKKENSERSNKIAQELFIIACASEMPLDKALQFHADCKFGVKELSQFGENGLSPLAAMMLSDKSPEEMQEIIDKGADINEKSPSGMTATDLAVLVGNEKMAETLEQKGGKLNLVSKERGREAEVEEENEKEKGREKSREREQEKQQRQIQKRQEAAQREQAARELKQQIAEERIQQQQIARQMQMVMVREAMEAHEERRAELVRKKAELKKAKEESDAKLREQEAQLKTQNEVIFKEQQQLKTEEKKIEKPPISELEKMLGTTLVDLNIDKLLFHAVRNGQQTMALLLVRFGGNVNHRENGISVLDAAVANGNNSLIATLFTFSSPDTIKKALAIGDANPQAQRLLENLVHEQKILPEVVEKKINDEVVIEKLPLVAAEEEVVDLESSAEFEIVEPVIKAEVILDPQIELSEKEAAVNELEAILQEPEILPQEQEGALDVLISEVLPEVEKLPLDTAAMDSEVAAILPNKESVDLLEIVEPIKAEVLELKIKDDFEIEEKFSEKEAVIIAPEAILQEQEKLEQKTLPQEVELEVLSNEVLQEIPEQKISDEVLIEKLPLVTVEIEEEVILQDQEKPEQKILLQEVELEVVNKEALPQVEEQEEIVDFLDKFELVEPVKTEIILEAPIKDEEELSEIEIVVSEPEALLQTDEEQEDDLQDEVEFLEEISPNLNQIVKEFDEITQPDELLLKEENSVDLPQENKFLEEFIQDLKESDVEEVELEDSENEISDDDLEDAVELDLNSQIQEFNDEIAPQILQQTSDEIAVKTVFQDMVLNASPAVENEDFVMIAKTPTPEKELPIVERQDSEIGDEENKNNVALESQRILQELEELELKKKSQKQEDESDLPLSIASTSEELDDDIEPAKASLVIPKKDSKLESQKDDDEIFISKFGVEESDNFKVAILEIREVLREHEGQEYEEESEFSDDKKSFDLGEAPSKSPRPVLAIKTLIIEQQVGAAMAA